MISNEVLCSYIDGELDPQDMERVRIAVAADEVLAARLRQFRRVDELLAEFSSGIDKEPLPAGVLALLESSRAADAAPADGLRAEMVESMPRRPRWRAAGVLALAASLVLAVAIGLQLRSRGSAEDSFDRLARIGPVAPSSALHHALEEVASDNPYAAAGEEGLTLTPVLSFVSTREHYCREFRMDAGARAARGLACRRNDHWETLKIVDVGATNDGRHQYATATAESDADFDAFVDSLVAEVPLGAEAEARALRDDWSAMRP